MIWLRFSLVVAIVLCSSVGVLSAQGPDIPDGIPGETYYAPFNVSITLDGELRDWKQVPSVTLPIRLGMEPVITFAAAADDTYLYFMADIIDERIIAGQHGIDYWNEDSVEFYINATGNMNLTHYTDGVAQIIISPLNLDGRIDETVVSGFGVETTEVRAIIVETDQGWAVEASVPLQNDVWDIVPTHEGVIGFGVDLNEASTLDRDTKLIWSKVDRDDQSWNNPSLFGQLIFYQIEETAPAASQSPSNTGADYIGDLELAVPIDGTISNASYAQLYSVELPQGAVFLMIMAVGEGSSVDPYLIFTTEDGEVVAQDDNSGQQIEMGPRDAYLAVQVPETGTYLVVATRAGANTGTSQGDYVLIAGIAEE